MTDEFQSLRELLANDAQPTCPPADEFTTPIYRRLARALNSRHRCAVDLAILLRQIIRRETERSGVNQSLLVSLSDKWPAPEDWTQFGVQVRATEEDKLLLTATPWRPSWLGVGPKERSPEAAVCAEEPRRYSSACLGDPFLRALGRENYLSRGQREAVRAVLSAPPASTLAVILPTGSGKSLCAHVLSQVPLVNRQAEGLVVVVVPTVALAVDQMRALADLIGHRCDYVGGSDPDQMTQNAAVRERIREGTQRIVFTSPESLLGSLRAAVYEAAQAGQLKALVIDEAHLVEKWGDEFRPSFQQLAGVRRGLLRCAPDPKPPTILLSATVTQSCLDTLQHLFGSPGPFVASAAIALRPEPSFWIAACENDVEKKILVDETLRHVPRPAILYTTRVDHAKEWYARLRADGFHRIGLMTGETPQAQRHALIQDWSAGHLDLMVATSAFGLGVDQNEVRTIVHACVPETADRYYQEVGRAGRDGLASMSVLVYDPVDLKTGGEMSRSKIISGARGGQRWRRMFDHRVLTHEEHLVEVDFSVTPGTEDREIDMAGKRHEAWNARTITLMARAGLVELDDIAVDRSDRSSGPSASRCVLRVLEHSHCDPETWESRVEPERKRTQVAERHQWRLMRQILDGRVCVSSALERMYRITVPSADGSTRSLPVARSCGGCAQCRRSGAQPVAGDAPPADYPWPPRNDLGVELSGLIGSSNVWALFGDAYSSKTLERRMLARVIRWLAVQGVHLIVGPPSALAWLSGPNTPIADLPVFLQGDNPPRPRHALPQLPTLRIAPNEAEVSIPLSLLRRMRDSRDGEPVVVCLFGSQCVSRDKPQTTLEGWLPCPRHTLRELDQQLQL